MAKLVFGMNQSLDGYVDHMAFTPNPVLFGHFIEQVRGQAGSMYGRSLYEVCGIGTRIIPSGTRRNATSRRHGGANRSGSCRTR
jgi:hypothetical protein